MSNKSKTICPLTSTEQRLTDCLNLFMETKTKYFDPDGFRLSLNNCIQTLRTVTFVLQKHKAISPKFDSWYEKWQIKMRSDSILKWLLEARNTIVKKGDLTTLSIARTSIVESWFDAPIFEMEIPPLTKTEHLAKLLAHNTPSKEVYNVGLLRLERRWVDSQLPEHEILESLSHAFQVFSELLREAHVEFLKERKALECGWYSHSISLKGKLPTCMIGQEWDRTIWVDIKTGRTLQPDYFPIKKIDDEIVRKHYPNLRQHTAQIKKTKNFKEHTDILFEHAKVTLITDGCHAPIAIVGYDDGTADIITLHFQNRTEKHFLIRNLAADIEKKGATSVILVNEAWFAPSDGVKLTRQDIESPNRREILQLIAVNKYGEKYTHQIFFQKDKNGKVQLAKKEFEVKYDSMNILEPIMKVWFKNFRIEKMSKDIKKYKDNSIMFDIPRMSKYAKKYNVKRNQTCLCGSGKKYKKCCLTLIQDRQKNIKKSVDLFDIASDYFKKKQYIEAELYFRAHLTQYIIWHYEHTVPCLENEPESAQYIYYIDIEAIIEISNSIAKTLYHQGKISNIHQLFEHIRGIVDNFKYYFYVDCQKAYWLGYDRKEEQAEKIMEGYLSEDLEDIPLTDVGKMSLGIYLHFVYMKLSATVYFKIIDKLFGSEKNVSDKIYFLTQKARLAFLNNDDKLAKSSANQIVNHLSKISLKDKCNSNKLRVLLPDTYQLIAIILNNKKYYVDLIQICKHNIGIKSLDKFFQSTQYYAIGQAYTSLGTYDKAIGFIKKALKLNIRPEYMLDLADAYMHSNEQKKALDVLNKINYDNLSEELKIDYLAYLIDVALTNKDRALAVKIEKMLAKLNVTVPYFQTMINGFRTLLLDFLSSKDSDDTLILRLRSFISKYFILKPNIFGFGVNLNEIIKPKNKNN